MFSTKLKYTGSIFLLPLTTLITQTSYAKELDEPKLPTNISPTGNIADIAPKVAPPKLTPTQLPSDTPPPQMTKEQTLEHLRTHPDDMEGVLSQLIVTLNADALKELLPIYATYPQRDQSLIDWGNAIIAMKNGDKKTSIALYRKLNAALPNNRTIQFQMASALFQDRQFKAAKNELQKLRSVITNPDDVKAINQYIEAINKQQSWNFNVNLSFLNNDNLGNAPPEGTQLDTDNGTTTNTTPHQKGTGLGYNLGADKKYFLTDRWFTAVHLNTDGSYYWDNKKYNDASVGGGIGIGYQNSKTEIELSPNFSQRWYGGGVSQNNDESLKKYNTTKAINFNLSHWLNQNWLYQNFTQYSKMAFEEPFTSNDGKYRVFSNTLVYFANPKTNVFGGFDYMTKDSDYDASESFTRKGVRVGWGQTWNKGYATRATFGVAKKDYDGIDFFGYQRENQEYNVGLSVWNRDFYILGLTPRLTWDYRKVSSNETFERRNDNNFNLILTKTF